MRCVPLVIPAFVVCPLLGNTAINPLAKHLTSNTHIGEDVLLQALDSRVTEGVAHDSSLARMLHLVDCRVYADRCWRAGESFVEASLADIRAEAVDSLQSGRCVDGKQVWSETNVGAILDVGAVECKMPAALVGVVCQIDVGDFGEERTWVFCEGMECETVENDCEDLGIVNSWSK
jgi:hypothetical protein